MRQSVPLHETSHAVACRSSVERRANASSVVSAEGRWSTCSAILDDVDARSRAGQRVLGESVEQKENARRDCLDLHSLLCDQSERIFLFHMINDKRLAVPLISANAPLMQRLYVRWLYPIWKRRAKRAFSLTREQIARDAGDVRAGFDLAGRRLSAGQTFISGQHASTPDLAFAAFSALVLLPERYAVALPKVDDCPQEFAELVRELRTHPASANAGKVTASLPGQSELVPDPRNPRLKTMRLWRNPRLLMTGARALLKIMPVVRVGKFAVLARHRDVTDALTRDRDFQIAPVNAKRINDVNHGPFLLGLDAGPQHAHEHARLYAAYRPYDVDRVHANVHAEAARLLDGASARGGHIEVVNSYARLAAARAAVTLFGISGPSEADLVRVIRRMFHHSFLNLRDKGVIRARGVEASLELKTWVEDEIARRRSGSVKADDLLGRMLDAEPGLSDPSARDLIRRNICGLLVGAIDTTATSVTHIAYVLLTRPDVRRQVEADIEYPARFRSWCWEILRLWPHNPLVLRESACPVDVGNARIGENKRVVALTLAAMQDRSVFPNPRQLELGRPENNYLHFGYGLHVCAGREFNRVQVPELVRLLLLRSPELVGKLKFEGPFPDELVVKLRML